MVDLLHDLNLSKNTSFIEGIFQNMRAYFLERIGLVINDNFEHI